ncbi:MAG: hypothetical protein ABEH66_07870 [Halobacteriales archaeon]
MQAYETTAQKATDKIVKRVNWERSFSEPVDSRPVEGTIYGHEDPDEHTPEVIGRHGTHGTPTGDATPSDEDQPPCNRRVTSENRGSVLTGSWGLYADGGMSIAGDEDESLDGEDDVDTGSDASVDADVDAESDVQGSLPEGMTVRTGQAHLDGLLERAILTEHPTELVIAPVELHQRNLTLCLTDADRPLDAIEIVAPTAVASAVLETMGWSAESLDYVDRLRDLEAHLAGDTDATDCFRRLLAGEPAAKVDVVEQARTEIETITNYHPTRVAAFRQAADSLAAPIEGDARDLLTGSLAVERALRQRTPTDTDTDSDTTTAADAATATDPDSAEATSEEAVWRRATRALMETDGAAWTEAYPSIERVWVVGLSTVPAPLADLGAAIASTTATETRFVVRAASGRIIEPRVEDAIGGIRPTLGQEVFNDG